MHYNNSGYCDGFHDAERAEFFRILYRQNYFLVVDVVAFSSNCNFLEEENYQNFSGNPILLFVGMAATRLPIIIFIDVTTGNNLVFNKRLDDNFRLQISRSVMVPSFIKIFQKRGIFEKTVYTGSGLNDNGIRADEIKDAKLIKKTDSSLIIKYQTVKQNFTENYDLE